MASCPTCGNQFKSSQGMKTHHTKVHGESIAGFETDCDNCGNVVIKEERKDTKGISFCNKECFDEWQIKSGFNEGENHPRWKGGHTEDKVCKMCGNLFKAQSSESEKRVTCSYECMGKLKSIRQTGEDNPNWRGGNPDYYGKDWPQQRTQARDKYDDICQNCGKESDEAIPVHHIIPVREFDNPNNAHYQDNLTQVCWTCHQKVEQLSESEQREKLK